MCVTLNSNGFSTSKPFAEAQAKEKWEPSKNNTFPDIKEY
jgi:hypothetical protein